METTLGISLYSCLYLKVAKTRVFLLCFMLFPSTKSETKRAEQVLPGSCWVGGVGVQIMYTHVSKCKNDKTKKF
jgi:hypothetical protein